MVADFMEKGCNPSVGTLAHLGQVDLRIAAKGAGAAEAGALIAPVESEIRRRLGDLIFGADADTLESEITARLGALGASVASVELGSGGVVGERLAAGVASGFAGGVILPDALAAPRIGVDLSTIPDTQDRARVLAAGAARWAGTRVGTETYFEDVPAAR